MDIWWDILKTDFYYDKDSDVGGYSGGMRGNEIIREPKINLGHRMLQQDTEERNKLLSNMITHEYAHTASGEEFRRQEYMHKRAIIKWVKEYITLLKKRDFGPELEKIKEHLSKLYSKFAGILFLDEYYASISGNNLKTFKESSRDYYNTYYNVWINNLQKDIREEVGNEDFREYYASQWDRDINSFRDGFRKLVEKYLKK